MDECYITFRSVTYAQKGERVLERSSIRCRLQRTPKWMEQQGCGYCIRLAESAVYRAVELLRRSQVPLRRVYVYRGGEGWKELEL